MSLLLELSRTFCHSSHILSLMRVLGGAVLTTKRCRREVIARCPFCGADQDDCWRHVSLRRSLLNMFRSRSAMRFSQMGVPELSSLGAILLGFCSDSFDVQRMFGALLSGLALAVYDSRGRKRLLGLARLSLLDQLMEGREKALARNGFRVRRLITRFMWSEPTVALTQRVAKASAFMVRSA